MDNETPVGESQNEVVDRKDVLREAFDNLETNVEQKVDSKPAIERPRDETGKFVNQSKVTVAKPKEEKTETLHLKPKEEEQAEVPHWKQKAPLSWKKEHGEGWNTLPEKVQEYIHQRESEMKAGVEPLKSKAQQADEMNAVFEPYMNTIRGLNLTPPQVMKGFLEADNILRNGQPQQKVQYLAQLAQHYGINIQQAAGLAPQTASGPDFHSILNQINSLRGEFMSERQMREQQENQLLLSDIEKFAQSHEHFETVKPAMIALLNSGQAQDLNEAYKKAIRLDDSLYQSELDAARQAEISKKDEAAKKARSAAVSVRSSTPGTNTTPKAQTRREMLEQSFSNVDSRL